MDMYILARIKPYDDAPGNFIDFYHKVFIDLMEAIKYAQIHRYEVVSIDEYVGCLGMPDKIKK